MMDKQLIADLEVLADMMAAKLKQVKDFCRKAREESEGVSTPSRRKARGLDEKQIATIIAKRRKYIMKSVNKKAASGN